MSLNNINAVHRSKTILCNASLREALSALNDLLRNEAMSTLFVLNDEGQLIGTLTDGDIRRSLLAGAGMESKASDSMKHDFSFITRNKFTLDDINRIKAKGVELLPVLDENKKIIKIIDLRKIKSLLPVTAIIMAGGEGKRLRPLTERVPKPLLHVGDKPILEYTIDRLISFGVDTIYISVNYLGEQIEAHFGDGTAKGVDIKYVREDKPLGTIGAAGLITELESEYLLITNSDLLTNIDYESLFQAFVANDADLIVATAPYRVNIPYGVMEVSSEDKIIGLKEKPTYTYYSNAGIYLVKTKHLDILPRNEFYNATDLMETMMKKNMNVTHYPILSYWLDIGMMDDYLKAQEDIKHLSLI